VIAARERKTEQRYRRLKNEPCRAHYYGTGLRDPDFTMRYWWPHDPSEHLAELIELAGYEAPIIGLHPEMIRKLSSAARAALFIGWPIRLEQLADRTAYRNKPRYDPWDWPEVGESVIDGWRSRQKTRWRREIAQDIVDWEQGDPNGALLGAGDLFERELEELLTDPEAAARFWEACVAFDEAA
jgi:hypothetical protein